MSASAESGTGRSSALIEVPEDIEGFSREAIRRGWSDGLPLVPPTEERVERMLGGTARDPMEIFGILSPRQGEATVHAIAINAVLAGCEPQHLPILLGAVEAITDPLFNLDGINATTHPCGVFVLVHGPAAQAAGIHGGSGCFGPTFPANVSIGRAMRLILLNIAGATPGAGDRATQGTPAKIAFCATERVDASPWPPFHTTRGLRAEESGVTAWACEGPHNIQDHGSNTGLGILQTVAGAMGQAGSNNVLARGEPVLALGPEHAATIANDGYSREDVQRYVFENARYPGDRVSPEFLQMLNERLQGGDARGLTTDDGLPIAETAEEIHVIVAGGPGKHSSWMPTFGGMTRPVTVRLD
ncbi:MAG: hypothetical protein U5Q44_01175 [Dehalococcoidia bacterium]|nr:hypothetical protein [Dehalococcoidia bacterium]